MSDTAEKGAPRYRCVECGAGITTADDLVTVNVLGHGKAAHRTCPTPPVSTEENPDGN